MSSRIITEVKITPEQIKRSKKLYNFSKIKNSFTEGKSQIYGALGEIIVLDFLGLNETDNYIGTKDADLLINGVKIDVKTKKVSGIPQLHYYNSISIHSLHQKCDQYYFVRILKDMTTAWICGKISKKDFMTHGKYFLAGELDPSSSGFKFKEDCMNLEIKLCEVLEAPLNCLSLLDEFFILSKTNNGYIISDKCLKENCNYSAFYLPSRQRLIIKDGENTIFDDILFEKQQIINIFV